MRLSHLTLFLGLSLIGCQSATAGPACAVLDRLQSAEDYSRAYKRARSDAARDLAARGMAEALSEIGAFEFAVRELKNERSAMIQFVETRRSVVRTHEGGAFRATSRTLETLPYLTAGDWLSSVRRQKRCGRFVKEETSQTDLNATTGLSSKNLTLFSGIVAAFIIAFGALAGVLLYRWYRIHCFRKARRAKRFNCRVDTKLRKDNLEHGVTVRDVSQLGAKLASAVSFEKGTKIEIAVGDIWVGATVRWKNKHFLGAEFDRPLDDAELFILTWSKRPKRKPQPARAVIT